MSEWLKQIVDEVRLLKLDDSLLFLNRLLAVERQEVKDPQLEKCLLSQTTASAQAFLVHFIAKQLLLHASNLGPYVLTPNRFIRLRDMYFQLKEPLFDQPGWRHADLTGLLERMLGQQLSSQRRNAIQKIGLALGLFRDVEPLCWPFEYNLRADIEGELGISVEEFMTMGFLTHSLAITGNRGTFTPAYLAEAFRLGVKVAVPEVWSKFLPRVACDRDIFRRVCEQEIYQVRDARYVQFEFNPLHRFPIIDLGSERFLAVDPDLVIERTTLGMFYDLFERNSTGFAVRFGHSFDAFVGKLLRSVCPTDSIWSASESEANDVDGKTKKFGKRGDWAYVGPSHNVLFECKSLRPSLELTMYGSDEAVQAVASRIAAALSQLIEQNGAIQQGKWREHGLSLRPAACVVVTYGRVQTVNGPFMRKRVQQQLADKELNPLPFVVLSLEELDIVIRLVELGHPLDEIILALCNQENSFDPLQRYRSELTTKAVSSYAYNLGEAFIKQITA